MAAALDGRRMRFVLSSGRSGTFFLLHHLGRTAPSLQVVHEIRTSHRVFMMMNAAERGLFPPAAALAVFRRERARRLALLPPGRVYVEINPFLAPLAPMLHEAVSPLRAIHLVRDPRDWIRSMANFKSLRWRRHFVDYVPFAQSVHPACRAEWGRLPYLVKCAWRWRYANERILEGAAHAEEFVTLRYEDLFAEDEARWRPALAALHRGLGLDGPPAGPLGADRPADNLARGADVGPWQSWAAGLRREIDAVCGPLMARFGYSGMAP